MNHRLPVVVLISGRGSNLAALIHSATPAGGQSPIDIRAVISNRPQAPGLLLARAQGIATEVIDHTVFAERAAFDQALRKAIDARGAGLVILAGFLRVLGESFIRHYEGRLLNVHPSLLPDLPGLHTHERVLAGHHRWHGATVHFVTLDVDHGPRVAQARVAVAQDDTPETLAARVLAEEHRIYPEVVRWFAEGRLRLAGDQVLLDGHPRDRDLAI